MKNSLKINCLLHVWNYSLKTSRLGFGHYVMNREGVRHPIRPFGLLIDHLFNYYLDIFQVVHSFLKIVLSDKFNLIQYLWNQTRACISAYVFIRRMKSESRSSTRLEIVVFVGILFWKRIKTIFFSFFVKLRNDLFWKQWTSLLNIYFFVLKLVLKRIV